MNMDLSILSSSCTIWAKKRDVEETSTHTRIHCFLTLYHMHLTKGKVGKNTAWTANCFEGLTRKKEIRYREEDPLPIYSRSMTLPSIKTYKTCCFLFSMFLLSSLQQSKHVELAVALGLWKQKGFFPSKNLPFFHRTKAAELPRWEYAYTGERGTQFGGFDSRWNFIEGGGCKGWQQFTTRSFVNA